MQKYPNFNENPSILFTYISYVYRRLYTNKIGIRYNQFWKIPLSKNKTLSPKIVLINKWFLKQCNSSRTTINPNPRSGENAKDSGELVCSITSWVSFIRFRAIRQTRPKLHFCWFRMWVNTHTIGKNDTVLAKLDTP